MSNQTSNLPNNPSTEPQGLRPFKHFCMTLGEIPSSYLASMTYYEMLLWFCDYLQNKVIPTVNNNAHAVEELQNLFIQLKTYVDNYFKNLDVQEEINNKLDEMSKNGALQNILLNYTSIEKIYKTTVDLINDKDNLVLNQKIKTLGYYNINDGGGAHYIIKETPENYSIKIKDNMYAQLIIEKNMCPEQFGAYGDGINDDTEFLKNTFYYAKNINFLQNKTYLLNINGQDETNGTLIGKTGQTIDFNGSTLKTTSLSGQYNSLILLQNINNVVIKNGILIGDRGKFPDSQYWHGINLQSSKNVHIENMTIKNFGGDAIIANEYLDNHIATENIYINNCILDNSYRNNISLVHVKNAYIYNNVISNANGTSPQAGIDIEPNRPYQVDDNINIFNNYFYNNVTRGISFDYHNNPSSYTINVDNCVFDGGNRHLAINENETADDTTGFINIRNCTSINVKGMSCYFHGHTNYNLPVLLSNINILNGNTENSTNINGSCFAFDNVTKPICDITMDNIKIKNSNFSRTLYGNSLKDIIYNGDTPKSFSIGNSSENLKIKSNSEATLLSGSPVYPTSSNVFSTKYYKSVNASGDTNLTFNNLPTGLLIELTNYSREHNIIVNSDYTIEPLTKAFWDTTNNILIK